MEYYIARCLAIGMLDRCQIEKLHGDESVIGYGFTPGNIAEYFHHKTIADHYNIPEDIEKQRYYINILRNRIRFMNLANFEGASGLVSQCNLEKLHLYDWNVYDNLDKLNMQYQHGRASRLKEAIMENLHCILM